MYLYTNGPVYFGLTPYFRSPFFDTVQKCLVYKLQLEELSSAQCIRLAPLRGAALLTSSVSISKQESLRSENDAMTIDGEERRS